MKMKKAQSSTQFGDSIVYLLIGIICAILIFTLIFKFINIFDDEPEGAYQVKVVAGEVAHLVRLNKLTNENEGVFALQTLQYYAISNKNAFVEETTDFTRVCYYRTINHIEVGCVKTEVPVVFVHDITKGLDTPQKDIAYYTLQNDAEFGIKFIQTEIKEVNGERVELMKRWSPDGIHYYGDEIGARTDDTKKESSGYTPLGYKVGSVKSEPLFPTHIYPELEGKELEEKDIQLLTDLSKNGRDLKYIKEYAEKYESEFERVDDFDFNILDPNIKESGIEEKTFAGIKNYKMKLITLNKKPYVLIQ